MDYAALAALAALTWRLIGSIRTPILKPIKAQLIKYSPNYGEKIYNTIVWLIAFVIGYAYATMAGQNGGDLFYALEWSDGYPELGYAATAILIASGSAGLRIAEKLFNVKTDS